MSYTRLNSMVELPIGPIAYLQRLLREPDAQTRQMIDDRDQVHSEYGRLFHPDHLDQLTAENFTGFLLYENNRHWWGIHRHQAKLVADTVRLRKGLAILLDESQPIAKRLDRIEPGSGPKPVPGLGKAVFTPILHVVYPDKYGVWNSISESAMTRLGFWPTFGWSASFGQQYSLVIAAIKEVTERLSTDLWTVDALWWRVEQDHDPSKHPFVGPTYSSGPNTSVPAPTRRLKGQGPTFVCSRCYLSKPVSLLASSESDVCIDCAN